MSVYYVVASDVCLAAQTHCGHDQLLSESEDLL